MKKLKEYGLTFFLVIILIICLIYYYTREEKVTKELKDVKLLPTIVTKLEDNTIYCPTFQLVWNDLKKEAGGNVSFIDDENNQMARELNLETFTENDISSDYYYKNYGLMTPSLKKEISDGIWKKFKQQSSILNEFNFQEDSKDYLFYAMLYREFSFLEPFDIINNDTFGITSNSNSKLDKNLEVLFYQDDSYAVFIKTKTGDEVILYKGNRMDSFLDTYKMIDLETKEEFQKNDTLTIPNLDFKIKYEYKELENKKMIFKDNDYTLDRALQTIEFKLDNAGGKVKSEAAISNKNTAVESGRYFNFSDDFILFVKESNQELPYLALNIKNIDKFK